MTADKVQPESITDIDEAETYIPLSLFWRIAVSVLTAVGLFFTVNHIFGLQLLRYFKAMHFLHLEFDTSYIYLVVACFVSIMFISSVATKKASMHKVPWYDVLLFGLTILVSGYLAAQAFNISTKGWDVMPPLHIGIASCIFCLLILAALRRSAGLPLFLVAIFFAVYPLFAGFMPGFLRGVPFNLWDAALYFGLCPEGLVGLLARVWAELLIGFLLFGEVLVITGAGKAFMKIAMSLLGAQRGGPAKVAIVASGLFGTMSGSVVANVMTTGSFTIPTMKKIGYPSYFAGAIEACSSVGGMIIPPVMGATAFLMASFLGISYFSVCVAAAIPALLYYLALFIQVHFYAVTHDLKGLDPSELPNKRQALTETLPYIFALLTLVWFLYLGLEARAPFYSSAIMLILMGIREWKQIRLYFKKLSNLFLKMGKLVALIGSLLVGIGYMTGSLGMTGVGNSFAHEIGLMAGENVALVLILAAIGSLVLGMGLTLSAIYVFQFVTVAPVLVAAGVNPLAASLFIIYFGLSADFTPPVAIGAFVAAGVAGASRLKTSKQAMRLGFPIYLLPFCFVFSPALLLQAQPIEVVLPLGTIILGILLATGGLEGYLPKFGRLSWYYRVPIFTSGLLLAFPGWQTDIIGAVVFLLTMMARLVVRRVLSSAGSH